MNFTGSWPRILLFLGLFLLAALGTGAYYLFNSFYLYSNDAYLNANVINIAPQISGQVSSLLIRDLQTVKKGDALFTIDNSAYAAAQQVAQANLAAAQSDYAAEKDQLNNANADVLERKITLDLQTAELSSYKKQAKKDPLTLKKLELAREQAFRDLSLSQELAKDLSEKAVTNLDDYPPYKQALAALNTANLNYTNTTIYAPCDGKITAVNLSVGDYVSAGQALFALIDTSHWWVVAKIKENDLPGIISGDKAYLYLPSQPNKKLQGLVAGTGWGVNRQEFMNYQTQSVLPYYKREINWIQLAQRFPVRIDLDSNSISNDFRVGESVRVLIAKKP